MNELKRDAIPLISENLKVRIRLLAIDLESKPMFRKPNIFELSPKSSKVVN